MVSALHSMKKGSRPSRSSFEIESFPLEEVAVGAFARTGIRAIEGDVCVAEASCESIEVAGMGGPADEARLGEFEQAVVVWCAGLLRDRGR